MEILTHSFVIDAIHAERDGQTYPIDFDQAWVAIGYSRKDSAKRALINSMLKPGKDYHLHNVVEMVKRPQGGGHRTEAIGLTVDAFKHFCLSAQTERGYEVRQYFIDVEKHYRAHLELQLIASAFPDPSKSVEVLAGYRYTFHKVQTDAGMKNPYYVRRIIVGGFDHRIVNGLVCVTYETYCELLLSFRSRKGADLSQLPIELQRFFKHGLGNKMNRRSPQMTD